ncbi:MAG: DUF4147 domain-containing protein [bacterium]
MGHIIQNFDALACPESVEGTENELRQDALAIAEAGYEAINVGNALRRKLKIDGDELIVDMSSQDPAKSHLTETVRRHLAERRVFFVGIGKCAFAAANEIEKLLGDKLAGGVALGVSDNEQADNVQHQVLHIVGTHPLPSEVNVQATERIIQFLSERTEEDLVIMLISGGGSTLLCAPEAPMTFEYESVLFKTLTTHGATIQEMNTVRKHISRARGGGLARAAYPAEIVSLIVSDIPGNDISFISSGPTVQDTTTVADAEAILSKYGITLQAGTAFIESAKEEKYFERVTNILFLTNRDALFAMQSEATQRGYSTEIVNDHFTGEARDIGRAVVEKLHTTPTKTALLYAGESTVTIGASLGKGGRNQEMALAVLETIGDGEIILPFSSDGRDNTDHAGAIGDKVSREHANTRGLLIQENLDAHSSYEFFSTTGDALITGYTESNVSDLIIALKN